MNNILTVQNQSISFRYPLLFSVEHLPIQAASCLWFPLNDEIDKAKQAIKQRQEDIDLQNNVQLLRALPIIS